MVCVPNLSGQVVRRAVEVRFLVSLGLLAGAEVVKGLEPLEDGPAGSDDKK